MRHMLRGEGFPLIIPLPVSLPAIWIACGINEVWIVAASPLCGLRAAPNFLSDPQEPRK
jgi:hypothetical protein